MVDGQPQERGCGEQGDGAAAGEVQRAAGQQATEPADDVEQQHRHEEHDERGDLHVVPRHHSQVRADHQHRRQAEHGQRDVAPRCLHAGDDGADRRQHDQPAPEHRRLAQPELADEVGRVLRAVPSIRAVVQTPQPCGDEAPAVAVVGDQRRRQEQLERHRPGGERQVRREQGLPRQPAPPWKPRTVGTVGSAGDEVDELGSGDGEHQHQPLAAHVVGGDGQQAEDDQVAGRRGSEPAPVHHPVEPPDRHGDGEHVRVLGEQLVGVDEVHVGRGEHGRQGEGDDAPGAAPDDAVVQHQPGGEHGDLDQLEAVEVDAPDTHERRQQHGPTPRIDRWRDRRAVVEQESVVGDDVGDVALEQALGHAHVQRPVVARSVAPAMQVDGDEGGAEDEQREQNAGHSSARDHPAEPRRPPFVYLIGNGGRRGAGRGAIRHVLRGRGVQCRHVKCALPCERRGASRGAASNGPRGRGTQ